MNYKAILMTGAAFVAGAVFSPHIVTAESKPVRSVEYVTIKWAGKENTHIVRPGGVVEFIGGELQKAPKPEQADERVFYMNLAMNGLTKEGYEVAVFDDDEILMKRAAGSNQ